MSEFVVVSDFSLSSGGVGISFSSLMGSAGNGIAGVLGVLGRDPGLDPILDPEKLLMS